MRGLPTRARKSQWYAATGQINVVFTESATWGDMIKPGSLEFCTQTGECYTLIRPWAENHRLESASAKVLSVLLGAGASERRKISWQDVILLRHVMPAVGDEYWDILVSPPNGRYMSIGTIVEMSTAGPIDQLIHQIMLFCTPCNWPSEIANDEAMSMPASDLLDLNTDVWQVMSKVIRANLGLETDQIRPQLVLGEIGFNSLDSVILIMEIEEEFDIDIPDEVAGNDLTPDKTLGEVHDWIFNLRNS